MFLWLATILVYTAKYEYAKNINNITYISYYLFIITYLIP